MINFQAIKQNYDLLATIGGDYRKVSAGNGGEFAGSCPFCGGDDRFRIQPSHENGGRWFCRQCSPKWGDVVDFIVKRDGVAIGEAVQRLTGGNVPAFSTQTPLPKAKPTLDNPPCDDWQYHALQSVYECAERLRIPQTKGAKQALKWLHRRGISDETINRFMLGYNPTWGDIDGVGKLCAGITIPSFAGQGLPIWYVQVRVGRNAGIDSKYLALTGSKSSSLFNANALRNADYGIVVEGEFDCMLLSQFVPDNVAVVTLGSANAMPSLLWKVYFAGLKGLYLALDRDGAGDAGMEKWQGWAQWASPMPAMLRDKEDITDAWKRGADLSEWVNRAIGGA